MVFRNRPEDLATGQMMGYEQSFLKGPRVLKLKRKRGEQPGQFLEQLLIVPDLRLRLSNDIFASIDKGRT